MSPLPYSVITASDALRSNMSLPNTLWRSNDDGMMEEVPYIDLTVEDEVLPLTQEMEVVDLTSDSEYDDEEEDDEEDIEVTPMRLPTRRRLFDDDDEQSDEDEGGVFPPFPRRSARIADRLRRGA